MSEVTLAPYILTDANGSNPRIIIPVKTPTALVLVESRTRGRLLVRETDKDGAGIAIDVARQYIRLHRRRLDVLYGQMERIRRSTSADRA